MVFYWLVITNQGDTKMDMFSGIYTWITANLSVMWVMIVYVVLTALGTIVNIAEWVIATTPAKSDDEALAKIEANWFAAIVIKFVGMFSLIKKPTV